MTRGMSPWEAATQIFHPPGPGRGGGSIGFIADRDGILSNKIGYNFKVPASDLQICNRGTQP